jgi:FMN-dependent NADH-azoreductase
MAMLLDVQALPRQAESRTRRLRDAFFAGVQQACETARIVTVDLAADPDALPAIDSWDIAARFEMAYGEGTLDEEQAARWDRIRRLTDQLHAASAIVISSPMWNLTVPWHLKRWIDCIAQARLTFEIGADGYHGLLGGRSGVVLTTRDGTFAPGTPGHALDHQIPYLRTLLGFMGIDPVHVVVAEGLAHRERREAILSGAIEEARELGRRLGTELAGR